MTLSTTEKRKILADFIEWTGGYHPSECEPMKVNLYIEMVLLTKYDPSEVKAYLSGLKHDSLS